MLVSAKSPPVHEFIMHTANWHQLQCDSMSSHNRSVRRSGQRPPPASGTLSDSPSDSVANIAPWTSSRRHRVGHLCVTEAQQFSLIQPLLLRQDQQELCTVALARVAQEAAQYQPQNVVQGKFPLHSSSKWLHANIFVFGINSLKITITLTLFSY